MEAMKKFEDIETALSQFLEAAIKHAEASEKGDYKTANKCYSVISKTCTYLRDSGALLELVQFLNHPSVGVRIWTATFLLPVKESDGIGTLERIVEENGIHSLTAKTTLSEWRKGNLKIYE